MRMAERRRYARRTSSLEEAAIAAASLPEAVK